MKIFYTGPGSNTTGEHSVKEFLSIMDSQFTNRAWTSYEKEYYYTIPQLKFKRYKLPEDFVYFNLQDWLQYSGSSILYTSNEEACNQCYKKLIIQDGECMNCEYIRFINLHCDEIFEPLEIN